MVRYNIVILDSAHEDMNEIYKFCSNVSISYSLKVKNKIAESINTLRYFPYIYNSYFITSKYILRKKIVDKRYLIIFSIIQNYVFIYNIIDGRRYIKPNDLFKSD